MDEPRVAVRQEGQRILLASDFSTASTRAREYVLALATPGARVTLVHALGPQPSGWPEPAYVSDWMLAEPSARAQARERLQSFGLPLGAAGLRVDVVVAEGRPDEVILGVSRAREPELVVVGTHGRRGFQPWLMGSTAERVVRLAEAPVLAIPASGDPAPVRVRHVMCALGSDPASAEALALAQQLAQSVHAELIVVHVAERFRDSPGASADAAWRIARGPARLRSALDAVPHGLRRCVRVRVGRPDEQILRAAEDYGADLVVMGAQDGHNAVQGFLGSTADQVVRQAACGVVTVARGAFRRRWSGAAEHALAG